jgi:hypothetical protein
MITQDAYNHSVTMTTDGTTDSYLVGGAMSYQFPAGTSDAVVAITLAIQANLILFNAALTDMVNNHYSLEQRVRWILLYLEGQFMVLPNRLTYLNQLLTWGNSISTYAVTYIATVSAMTNPTTIAGTQPDFSAIEAADPKLTLLACMQIVG